MESFGLSLASELNKSSTNAKTQIDYCYTNMKNLKCDYFESLTSFHKPIWVRKHGMLTESHADEDKQYHTDISMNTKDLKTIDHSDRMEVDDVLSIDRYEIVVEDEQIDVDTSFNFDDLHITDQSDMMEIDEESSLENYETIDSHSRRILNQFLRVPNLNNISDVDRISNQAQIIINLIERVPFITMQNKDRSVQFASKTEHSIQAFDLVYARTRTTADGNCLYSSLSILNVGSERLTHSMRLLAVNAMINRSDYFRSVCTSLNLSFERELERTARNTVWGGEVQMLALSVALSRPIYTYRFASDPKSTQYVSSDINLQDLVERFNSKTAGGHFKYVGYKADVNKLGFCIYYNGYHFDALLPFEDNPLQFVPHFDLISMTL